MGPKPKIENISDWGRFSARSNTLSYKTSNSDNYIKSIEDSIKSSEENSKENSRNNSRNNIILRNKTNILNVQFLNKLHTTVGNQIMTTTDTLTDSPKDNTDTINTRRQNKVSFDNTNSNHPVKTQHKKTKTVEFSHLVEIYEVDSYKEMNQLMNLDDYDYMSAFKEQKAMNLVKCCCNIY
jgi:hypothetical protein